MTATEPEPQPTIAPTDAPPVAARNGFAVAGFVLGLVSLLTFTLFLPAVLGIVFSAIGLQRAARGGRRGLALWGLGTAIVGLLLGFTIGGTTLTNFFDSIDAKPATIDGSFVEKEIKAKAQDPTQIQNVDCPDAPEQKTGSSFHCVVKGIDGSTALVTVNVEDDQGDITWSVK